MDEAYLVVRGEVRGRITRLFFFFLDRPIWRKIDNLDLLGLDVVQWGYGPLRR